MAIVIAILNVLIVLTSLFLICLILIQRGKGGGLAGAFGGVGGSSAFGTKAGDVFTRVTMIVATVWFVLSMLLVILYNRPGRSAFEDPAAAVSREVVPKAPAKPKAGAGATGTGADAVPTSPALPAAGPTSLPPAIPDKPAVPTR